ncbi:MAG: aspartate/glutamate racemase family protein [Bacillota bacterium]
MRILLVNPVTGGDEKWPERVETGRCAPDVILYRTQVPFGPESVETYTDESYAAVAVLETIVQHRGDFDAFVVGCFSDPGVWPAREVVREPVVGIGEAAMLLACSLGRQFSLLGTVSRDVAVLAHLVERLGLKERLASIRPIDREVIQLRDAGVREQVLADLTAVARAAISEDHAEVLCPGCGGLAGFCEELAQAIGVPVVDPVGAGIAWAEMQVRLRLSHSGRAMFAPAHPKDFGISPEMQAGCNPFRAVSTLYRVRGGSPTERRAADEEDQKCE